MEYLFTTKNLKILESYLAVDTIYGFDFDGTLAPIVEDRDKARMSRETEELLNKFIKQETVAIITGRSTKDIQALMASTPHHLIGNHGSEGLLSEEASQEIKNRNTFLKDQLLNSYSEQFLKYGVEIEDKTFSLSLHYRNSSNYAETEKFLSALTNDLPDAKIISGKLVVNILPNEAPTKSVAFLAIMKKEKARFGFYIGDDVTDEDIFRLRNPRIITIRVGEDQSSKASFFIKDQNEINHLLEHLCKFKSKD